MEPNKCLIYILLHISIIICPSFQESSDHSHHGHHGRHGIVMDAGSSSIKVRIYKWTHGGDKHTRVPKLHQVNNKRIRTSLSKFVREPDMLELQLVNALDVAVQFFNNSVDSKDFNQIPLFLMSTAGSRTLSGHDARYFIKTIRRFLSNSTINPFYFKPRHVQILSGEEEGVYSWLSTNYLLDFFNISGPAIPSVGVLELGGGSTQITFIPHDPLYDGEFHIYMTKKRYEIYVHSYLNYGQNYIKNRVHKWLLRHHGHNKSKILDPCQLKGDRVRVKHGNKTQILHGDGNMSKCQKILMSFLEKASGDRCSPKPCAIGPVYQPSVSNITFYAIGAFKYAPTALGALDETKTLNITKLKEMTALHCPKNMSSIGKNGRQYASDYCLMGAYLSLLLTQAYGFNETSSNIIISDRINGKHTDWSLGVMLHEVMAQESIKAFKPVVEINCPSTSQSVASSTTNIRQVPTVYFLYLMITLIVLSTSNLITGVNNSFSRLYGAT